MAKRVYGQAAKTVTPEEALDLVLRFSHMTAPEIVSLSEAGGRTLDQDVIAAEPLPGNDRSLADGFAVGREDLTLAAQGKPLRLSVRDGNCSADAEILSGTAVRLSAGETIPPGTGAVCRFEAAHVSWDGRRQVVDIPGPVRPWENIVRRGEEIARGTRVLAAGSVVGPAE
ncbi:molybdopterin molybdenumtransferase MoeA, partial [Paenibacillus chitinolyticus]|nr:molybdopterin molybdenumtransferase MoeA [Paenibacillus chitinolyticus]